jgi:hypothetical protein
MITMDGSSRGGANFLPSSTDHDGAEIAACRQAMELVKVLNLKKVVLELDCSTVVSRLNG